ncbi:MAG: hypothetical protein R2752_19010 [Vicinamibacterales bacterium]
MTDDLQVIEAFADGERVDAEALMAALADARGRAHFVDVLVLRELVDPRAGVGLPVSGRGGEVVRSGASWSSRFVAVAAAAALVVSLGAGFAVGWGLAGRAAAGRGGAPASATPAGTPLPPIEAPAPTRVIRFEPGVDWTEGTGGD